MSLLVALLLTATPAFEAPLPSPPRVEIWAPESYALESFARLAKLPNASVVVATRSNMLRPEHLLFLRKHRAGGVLVRAPLLTPHVEQFRRLPETRLLVELGASPDATLLTRLGQLGPQPVRVRAKLLDEALLKALEGLKNAELELDLRGRVPDQEELARLRRLRSSPSLRLDAGQAELVAGLAHAKPRRLIVEAADDRIPGPMQDALLAANVPVRVALSTRASPSDVERFKRLPGLELELRLSEAGERDVGRVAALVRGLSPEGTQ